jgi:hypothetical protein
VLSVAGGTARADVIVLRAPANSQVPPYFMPLAPIGAPIEGRIQAHFSAR